MQNQIWQNLDKRMIFKEFLAATLRKNDAFSLWILHTYILGGQNEKTYSQPSQLKLENSKPTYLDKK